jgi:hypothetical protein
VGYKVLMVAAILVLGRADASAGSSESGVTTSSGTPSEAEIPATDAAAFEYWTPERMRSATPREAYRVVTPEEAAEQAEFGGRGPAGTPKGQSGQSGGGSMSDPDNWRELSSD